MKHSLLIILSFLLLLSSPVIGQKTGVLYQYETSSGIQWKTFGDGKVQPKYTGEIKNGKMDGLGVLIYPYDGKSVVGEWKNGKEWNTKHTKKDGTLVGKYENGELRWGRLFGRFEGLGKIWFENKDENTMWDCEYIGEIKNIVPNGQGTNTFRSGYNYVGEWKDGKMNGQGTYTESDGDNFVGEWKDDEENGHGTYTFSSGGWTVGEWKNGKQWNTRWNDRDGNIIMEYVNGEMKSP
jgi:hypothetical protein